MSSHTHYTLFHGSASRAQENAEACTQHLQYRHHMHNLKSMGYDIINRIAK